MRSHQSAVRSLVFSIFLSGFTSLAQSAEFSWDGGAGTEVWSQPTNWFPNMVPAPSDATVLIGNLPGTQGASVRIDQPTFVRRLVLFNGAQLDTGESYLRTLGNTVLRGDGSRLSVQQREIVFNGTPVRQTSFETYNLELREDSVGEIDDANVSVWTQGAGIESFGVISIDPDAMLVASGESLIRFSDGLQGSQATQLNNNGTLRVSRPAGATKSEGSTLSIHAFDPGAIIDLDGDTNEGIVELAANTTLDIAPRLANLEGTINLAAGATLKFANATSIGDAVINVDGGTRPTRIISRPIDTQRSSTINVKAGTLEFGTKLTTSSLTQLNVAAGATAKFNRETAFNGKLNLMGAGAQLVINNHTTVNSRKFDWDGLNDDAVIRVNSGGRLTVNSNRYGDGGFDGRMEVEGGMVETIPNVPWRLLGTLNLTSTKTQGFFNTRGDLTIARSGTISLSNGDSDMPSTVLTGIGGIRNRGIIQGNGLVVSHQLVNEGLLRATGGSGWEKSLFVGVLDPHYDLDGQRENGRLEAIEADLRVGSELTDDFDGVASVGPGRTLDFRRGWVLGPRGELNLRGGSLDEPATVDTTFILSGPMQLGGVSDIRGTINVFSSGQILGDAVLRSGATINLMDNFGSLGFGGDTRIEAGVDFLPDGAIFNLPGGMMTVEHGADFGGVALANDAQLRLEGDWNGLFFNQRDSGVLRVEIGGTSTEQYNQVIAGIGASLDGTLHASFTDNFVASDGDVFSIIIGGNDDEGGVGGRFDRIIVPQLPDGLDWYAEYLDQEFRLSVEHDGITPFTERPQNKALQSGFLAIPEPGTSTLAMAFIITLGAFRNGIRSCFRVPAGPDS